MFSKYGQKLYTINKNQIVFGITLQNFQKIGIKTHPDCVKDINPERVKQIVAAQEQIYQQTGTYHMTGSWVVAAVPRKKRAGFNYIFLDGRHRYYATLQLQEPVELIVEVLRIPNYQDLKNEFVRINKFSAPSPVHKLKQDLEVDEAVDRLTIAQPDLVAKSNDIKDWLTESELRKELETADQLYQFLQKAQKSVQLDPKIQAEILAEIQAHQA